MSYLLSPYISDESASTQQFRHQNISGATPGHNMLMYAPGLFEENKPLVITERQLSTGTTVPLHWHDYFELEIILSGKADHTYNDTKHTIGHGWIYFMSYYDFHAITATEDLTLLNVRFTKDIISEELFEYITSRSNKLTCALTEDETHAIIKKIQRINTENIEAPIFSNEIIRATVSEIIIFLIRKAGATAPVALPKLVHRATGYINTNFRNDLSLEKLAKHFSVSPNYLGSQIKKNLGISFNEYLNNVRLRYSCNLLASSELSVKEIAYSSGYNSVEYFLYIFKNKMKTTPRNYRKLHKTNCEKE